MRKKRGNFTIGKTYPTCLVDVETQSLGEELGLVGAPFGLTYRSNRVPGRKDRRVIDIPLSDDEIPARLKKIGLKITVAGRIHKETFEPETYLSRTFVRDGRDEYVREAKGGTTILIDISSTNDPFYYRSRRGSSSRKIKKLGTDKKYYEIH